MMCQLTPVCHLARRSGEPKGFSCADDGFVTSLTVELISPYMSRRHFCRVCGI